MPEINVKTDLENEQEKKLQQCLKNYIIKVLTYFDLNDFNKFFNINSNNNTFWYICVNLNTLYNKSKF